MINSELFRNVELGECEPLDRLLYIGMIVNADDEGRLRANPKYLRATIFPFDLMQDEQILAMRDRLTSRLLIQVYAVEGMEYLQHPKWEKWQILRKDRMKASDCPPPDNQVSTNGQTHGGHPAAEEKLTQEKRTQPNPRTSSVEVPAWMQDLRLYAQDEALCKKLPGVMADWGKAFPGVSIETEVARAHSWELANPARQKKNRIRFLYNWLSRAQDRGGHDARAGGRDRKFSNQSVATSGSKYD